MEGSRTLDDLDVDGQTVLVRADLNVPMKDLHMTDGLRIERLTPTLRELLRRGAKIVLLSHFGRPDGKFDPKLSLRRINEVLGAALNRPPLAFAENCVGPEAERAVRELEPGEIVLMENLRFHPGEEDNDPAFAKALSRLGDLYVNEAFSCSHRAHASIEGITHHLPSAAGRGMEAELTALHRALDKPERPVAAIVGGSKVTTKLAALTNLLDKVQVLAIAGGMANTFLHAQGVSIGKSLFEPDLAETARQILAKAARRGCAIVLPEDAMVAPALKTGIATMIVPTAAVPADQMILDIGPKSVATLIRHLRRCRTLVWNGPLGAFEIEPFDRSTTAIARAVAELTTAGTLLSVAGGGDTMAALAKAGVDTRLTYVSAAGGAFLEWLEGRILPGVQALLRQGGARR
ncbi:MAG: phosphoglycerate kinase [Alphaproteobacteria bacterium]|nr:phosphoglycerate kinase [Alphaproteobacteria bacterium]